MIQKLVILICATGVLLTISCNKPSPPKTPPNTTIIPTSSTPIIIQPPTNTGNQQPNLSEYCNWGFAPPEKFECNGKTYVYGSAACASGFYENIFCEEQYASHGYTCQQDNSSYTIICFALFKDHKKQQGQPIPEE